MRRRIWIALSAGILLLTGLAACGAGNAVPDTSPDPDIPETGNAAETRSSLPELAAELPAETEAPDGTDDTEETAAEDRLRMRIGDTEVSVAWEDNESVAALADLAKDAPLVIHMSMYGGFEQVGPLGAELPRNDKQTTTEAGDIVLYSGDRIVVFYGSNAWSYTRLGRITDKSASEMAELLGGGDVVLTISYGSR